MTDCEHFQRGWMGADDHSADYCHVCLSTARHCLYAPLMDLQQMVDMCHLPQNLEALVFSTSTLPVSKSVLRAMAQDCLIINPVIFKLSFITSIFNIYWIHWLLMYPDCYSLLHPMFNMSLLLVTQDAFHLRLPLVYMLQ